MWDYNEKVMEHFLHPHNAGEIPEDPYWQLEKRAGDLYGLFCVDAPEPPGKEENRRVVYVR